MPPNYHTTTISCTVAPACRVRCRVRLFLQRMCFMRRPSSARNHSHGIEGFMISWGMYLAAACELQVFVCPAVVGGHCWGCLCSLLRPPSTPGSLLSGVVMYPVEPDRKMLHQELTSGLDAGSGRGAAQHAWRRGPQAAGPLLCLLCAPPTQRLLSRSCIIECNGARLSQEGCTHQHREWGPARLSPARACPEASLSLGACFQLTDPMPQGAANSTTRAPAGQTGLA